MNEEFLNKCEIIQFGKNIDWNFDFRLIEEAETLLGWVPKITYFSEFLEHIVWLVYYVVLPLPPTPHDKWEAHCSNLLIQSFFFSLLFRPSVLSQEDSKSTTSTAFRPPDRCSFSPLGIYSGDVLSSFRPINILII